VKAGVAATGVEAEASFSAWAGQRQALAMERMYGSRLETASWSVAHWLWHCRDGGGNCGSSSFSDSTSFSGIFAFAISILSDDGVSVRFTSISLS
jgi:hypothetical protein